MARMIVGRFSRHRDALDTANELVRHGVDQARMSLVPPQAQPPEIDDGKPRQGGATEMDGAAATAALTGAATIGLIGGGLALLAGPMAALAGAQMMEDEEETAEDRRFQRILTGANIAASAVDARAYVEDVRAGSTILAVEVDERQEELAADVFHRYGGRGLSFRALEP